MSTLRGKYALVTGGAQGIGFACIKELLLNGIKGVTLVDIDTIKGMEATESLKAEYGMEKVIFVSADVSKTDQLDDAFKKSLEHWKQLDLVVNNAGIIAERNWESALWTNCGGPLQGTLLGIQYMSKQHNGSGGIIVNIASISGVYPTPVVPVYSATKAFTVMSGRCLGDPIYYDHNGVKVITVCPGMTSGTGMSRNPKDLIASESFCSNTREAYGDYVTQMKFQTAGELARSLMEVIIKGNSGTVWAISGSEITQIDFSTTDKQCNI